MTSAPTRPAPADADRGPRARGCPAPGRAVRRRRLGPRPGAVLLGRLAVPGPAAGGRPAPARRRGRRGARGLPRARGAAHRARRRHVGRRQRGRPGRRAGLQPPPEPDARRSTPRRAPRWSSPASCTPTCRRRPRPHGLRFGPDPSHAQPLHDRRDDRQQRLRLAGAGATAGPSDNVVGARRRHRRRAAAATRTGRSAGRRRVADARARWSTAHLATIRTELGRFGRQVSGYALEHLLPERGFDVARALVGTEGTCALVLGATVRLVADARLPALVVLGYPDMADAADAVAGAARARADSPSRASTRASSTSAGATGRPRRARPAARRGLAARRARRRRPPPRSAAAAGAGRATPARWTRWSSPTPAEAAALWRIREDGAGLAGRTSRTAGLRTPAGRTPPSRRSGSAPTCASSTR